MIRLRLACRLGAITLAVAGALAIAAPAGAASVQSASGECFTVTVSPTLIYASYNSDKVVGETYAGDEFNSDPYEQNLGYVYGTSSNGYTGWVHEFDLTPGCPG